VTRVLLVDDHRLVLAGLARVIESAEDLTVVGAATGGEQALAMVEESQPDVVLMDLSMPGLDGIQTTRELLRARPGTRVLVLTSFADRDRIMAAVSAGAVGYLLKDSDPDDLLRGIRAAARGESPLDPRVAREVLRQGPRPSAGGDLTERERDVLVLVTRGARTSRSPASCGSARAP
jgi:DNA-binding NarL/FixJ family response regulator